MTVEERDKTIRITIDKCMRVLKEKAEGYSTDDDVLHNFRVAAGLQGCSVTQALAGMMTKHTVSVYDMINSGQAYAPDIWDEKIGDLMNYLLLLRTAVKECGLEEPRRV